MKFASVVAVTSVLTIVSAAPFFGEQENLEARGDNRPLSGRGAYVNNMFKAIDKEKTFNSSQKVQAKKLVLMRARSLLDELETRGDNRPLSGKGAYVNNMFKAIDKEKTFNSSQKVQAKKLVLMRARSLHNEELEIRNLLDFDLDLD